MSTTDFSQIDKLLSETLEKPGHWRWMFDEPEMVFQDRNNPPIHRPAGHWEWIPSGAELFQREILPTPFFDALSGHHAPPSKGIKIPFRKRDESE